MTEPGSVYQRWIIQAVALGEKVVAITSSRLYAWQEPNIAASHSVKAPTLAKRLQHEKSRFVIPFINIDIT
ncbi:hypothetical protein EE449_13495 [Salmonella enterica]|nr:hypothetical protein [Salmonella enterica]